MTYMELIVFAFILLSIVGGLILAIYLIMKTQNEKGKSQPTPQNVKTESLQIEKAYQKKWLFSYNEKDAYQRLKAIAEPMGFTVFAKVRLLDLLEPVRGNRKYKTYFYKIQAKHVDFVLCDSKLVARYIIELDDSSHDTEERKERDAFVDEVVKSVGYKIIHTRAITDEIQEQLGN